MTNQRSRTFSLLLCLSATALVLRGAVALADGGAVRMIATDGGLQISVFTSPVVLSAGEVDISVLVQDSKTLATVPSAQVEVELTPQGRHYASERLVAKRELATNKLFQSCHITLDEGIYDVRIVAENGEMRGCATFALPVGPQPTTAAAFWPWFTWPAVPVLLWIAHLFVSPRRNGVRQATTNRGAENSIPVCL